MQTILIYIKFSIDMQISLIDLINMQIIVIGLINMQIILIDLINMRIIYLICKLSNSYSGGLDWYLN
jgi:hypothetical protein